MGAQAHFQSRLDHLFGERRRLARNDARNIQAAAGPTEAHAAATQAMVADAIEQRFHRAVADALESLEALPMLEDQRGKLREALIARLRAHMASDLRDLVAWGDEGSAENIAIRNQFDQTERRLVRMVDRTGTGGLSALMGRRRSRL